MDIKAIIFICNSSYYKYYLAFIYAKTIPKYLIKSANAYQPYLLPQYK